MSTFYMQIYIQPGILFHEHDMNTHQLVDLTKAFSLHIGMACMIKGDEKVVSAMVECSRVEQNEVKT